ncbi:MAG: outer membrane beta-barrel protein, partial [Planctomycetales bacterium]|nr:outer membrane beta-barrel protein [Planctomycetales bacterium]
WDWGFRADVLYGVDGQDLQAYGHNPAPPFFAKGWDNSLDHGKYGWALPQAYVELANGDWRIMAGHFMKLAGFETLYAPGRFFYSLSYATALAEQHTFTGAIASYQWDADTQFFGGYSLGIDTAFDSFGGGSNGILGVSRQLDDWISLAFVGNFGNLGWFGDGVMETAYLDIQLTDQLQWVLQGDLVDTTEVLNQNFDQTQYAITNYLFYSLTDRVSLGGRVEWWKTKGVYTGNTQSAQSATLGLNLAVSENLRIRPEYRHNWGAVVPNLGADTDIFGIDAILFY